jgi:hypothetical protein
MNIALLLKAAGKWGGVVTIIALVIALLRQLIDLIGFVMMAFKLVLIVGFFALILFIGLLVYRTFRQRKREREEL